MSNFTNFPPEFNFLNQNGVRAERYVYDDPEACAFYCRKTIEAWIDWIYENEPGLEIPYDSSLNNLLNNPELANILDPLILKHLHSIRVFGNKVIHDTRHRAPDRDGTMHILKLTYGVVRYFVELYDENYDYIPGFDMDKIPEATQIRENKTRDQIKELIAELEKTKELHKQTQEKLQQTLETRIHNQQTVEPTPDPDEAMTRKIYIDSYLEEAGWDVSDPKMIEFQVEHFPNKSGKGYVDYVLWGKDGNPLAVIEAKRTGRKASAGRHQAELYADALEKKYGQRPFVFYTNGYKINFIEDDFPPREVYGFYSRDELQLLISRRNSKIDPDKIEVNEAITDRYYQIAAIRAVANRFKNKYRGALLVMATGTGKTRTAASLVDVLTRANWVKNVLFLADRRALVRQAKNSFNQHLPNFPAVNLVEEKEKSNSRIVFSTYQTLHNLIDKIEEGKRFYGVGHFDLIIFDEIHRSVYNKYRAIFEYFDGFKVGLTATPRYDQIDRNTYELFGLDPGNPTYNYDYAKAVDDGHLEDYRSLDVETKFRRTGIKYHELSDQEKLEYEEKFGDPLTGEFPDEIEASALDNWIYNKGTADLIFETLMKHGIQVNSETRLGKTILFTRKHEHAVFLEEVFNRNYPHLGNGFLKVIDYQTEHSETVLEDFKIKDKNPIIACSVDMLDTGIDVPEVVNLVFLKPIKSHIKFWQMIGRGTRKCPDLLGPGRDKDGFLILDFCDNFEYFNQNKQQKIVSESPGINERLFLIRLKLSQLLLVQEDEEVVRFGEQLLDVMCNQVKMLYAQGRESYVVRRHLKAVEKFLPREAWNHLNDEDKRILVEEIASLVYDEDRDPKAKLFDLMMYDLMVDLLSGGSYYPMIVNKVIRVSEQLQRKSTIPQIRNKMVFLQKIAQPDYWENLNPLQPEKVRIEIRDLMKFLDSTSEEIVVTNLTDEIINISESPSVFERDSFNKEAYKRKVEQYIRENRHHLTIDKIRKNQPVTPADLDALETMLFDQGDLGTKELFREVYDGKSLGSFIRSLLGLDKEAAQQAFSGLINDSGLNDKQIRFLEMIINHFVQNGKVTSDNLFNPPFTHIDNRGVLHLFGSAKAGEIRSIIDGINLNGEVG